MTTTGDNRTESGMVRTFVTGQPIVCGRCEARATHGAAVVDSGRDYPEDDYPIYQALLFCAEHADRDHYRWPQLESVIPIGNFGRFQVTVGELRPSH